jgi:formylglycine-generating enzyme required for sulfatase activity
MNCVTYGEAEAYCAWRGGRLPSEAEWELAAVGSPRRAFPWGSAAPGPVLVNACGVECKNWHTTLGLQPVFESQMYDGNDGYAGTAPVGSFPEGATPEGVLDLLGNVAEWTSGRVDVYDGDQAGQEGAVASHVVRGGAFSSGQEALAAPVLQQYLSGEARDRSVGFRCVFSATNAGGSVAKSVPASGATSAPASDGASGAAAGASEAPKAALN